MATPRAFCSSCGGAIEDNDLFCASCGRKLSEDSTARTQTLAPDISGLSSSVAIESSTRFSPTQPDASTSTIKHYERTSPLEEAPGPKRRRFGKRVAALILVLIVILIATAVFVSSRKEPPLSATPQVYRPGPIAPSPISLEAWVFHYAKSIQWRRVGGLQTVIVRISDVEPRWGTWELGAARADPLSGYSYDANTGWKNVQGVPVPPVYLPGPPKDMPREVIHGKWTQIIFAMKTTSVGLEIESKHESTANYL